MRRMVVLSLLATVFLAACGSNNTLTGNVNPEEMAKNAINSSVNSAVNGTPTLNGLPDWAKAMGLEEPQGLTFDTERSTATSFNSMSKLDSINYYYTGDYDTATKELKRLATKLGFTKSFLEDLQPADEKKILYTNVMGDKGNTQVTKDYIISLEVDENGVLSMNVSNAKQVEDAMNTLKEIMPEQPAQD